MSSRNEQSRNTRQEALRIASQGNGSIENGWREDLASQEYLDALEKYSGHPLYSELANNPYRYFYQSPTAFGTLGDESGLWQSSYTKNRLQAKQSFQEAYLAALEKINAYDINLPANQTNLERQAGLNPDLTGISGTGTVTDADNPVSSPEYGVNEELTQVQSVATGVMSFFTFMSNLFESVQGMQSNELNLIGQDIANNKAMTDSIVGHLAGTSFFKDFEQMSDEDLLEALDAAEHSEDITHLFGYSKRSRKLSRKIFNAYRSSIKNGDKLAVARFKAALRKGYTEDSFDSAHVASHPAFDQDFNSMLGKMGDTVTNLEYDAWSSGMRSTAAKNEFDSRFFHMANEQNLQQTRINREKTEAKKVAAETEDIESQKNWRKEINDTWKSLLDIVDEYGEDWWSPFAKIAIAVARSQSQS